MSEIERICSTKDASVFRDSDRALMHFNWESLWHQKAKTLLHMYRNLFCGADKPLICFAISLIIKYRSPKKMGVVQRAISMGNGTNKQVSLLFLVMCYLLLVAYVAVQLFAASNGLFVIQWHH